MAELLGLSVRPGMRERRERKERDESRVSDLPKEGYDWRPSSEPFPDLDAPASLEDWLPMVSQSRSQSLRVAEKEAEIAGLDGVRVSGLWLWQGRLGMSTTAYRCTRLDKMD